MRAENNIKIKKEDKHALLKFVIIILISLACGLVVGMLMTFAQNNFANLSANFIKETIIIIAPYANLCLLVVSLITVTTLFKKSRNLFNAWDGEDETVLEKMELNLSYAMWIISLSVILSFFFFALGFWKMGQEEDIIIRDTIIWFISFIVINIVNVKAQQKIVNLIKEINPEKEGSVYDAKFQQKWVESCDEAQKLLIYKSAYHSFKAITVTCYSLWVFCIVGAFIWDFGLVPVTLVTIIWIVQTTTYSFESIRLERKNK